MKFSCAKTQFEQAVGIAERFTGKNLALPVLGNILIRAEGNVLVVTGTNLEHAVEFRVPAKISHQGQVCVPAKVLSSLLQSFADEKIEAEGERGNLHLRTQGREGRVNGSNPEEFPLIPKIKPTNTFFIEAQLLSRALLRVLPAASISEFKPELGGIFFRAGKDTLALCATDTFRLAECTLPLAKDHAAAPISFIVPYRPAGELARILDGEDGEVSLLVGENQLLIETQSSKVTSRLIEGNFPEYKAIVPLEFTTSVYLEREELIRGIRASSIFASKLQEVSMHFSQKQVKIAAANADIGEYRTEHPCALSGKEITMSFNWRYLLDGAQALEDDEVFFGCNQESSPALLRNKSHAAFMYVVMPIRLT